ncbi:hypothetical protein, partial [Glaesserella parasuis]|uniref:hypothetical protein n=1 Tax=Glaesserella parasuis TaxID=738 RepID=UPI003F415B1D
PLRVARSDVPTQWVELSALDVRSIAPSSRGDARHYVGALPSTEIVHLAAPDGFEELRVLTEASAPNVARWRLRLAEGLVASVREGRIELRDA